MTSTLLGLAENFSHLKWWASKLLILKTLGHRLLTGGSWRGSMAGVSNTRPAGRMWPARRVYAARVFIKIFFIMDKTTFL